MLAVVVARCAAPSKIVIVLPGSPVPDSPTEDELLQLLSAGAVMAGAGSGVSATTVNDRVAGDGSTMPPESIARTENT